MNDPSDPPAERNRQNTPDAVVYRNAPGRSSLGSSPSFSAYQARARSRSALGEVVAAEGRAERVLFALLPAFLDRRVRRALYEFDAELFEQTATCDIRLRCDAGWLRPRGKARGTYYVGGPRTEAIRVRVAEDVGPLTDPYA